MSRSPGIQNPGILARIVYFFAKRALGRIPAGVRIRAFDPTYLRIATRMDIYSAGRGTVSMHLKELAQLKVAVMVGCPF
jgi:hypothetical protein